MSNYNDSISSIDVPVLFLVFNRPDTTMLVFDAIRLAKPKRLYIASDGPRKQKAGETDLVNKVRSIVGLVDWDCEIKTLFQDKNLGCKIAVTTAINWFFEHEDSGIILEDDCLPSQSFFRYCQELLNFYRNNENIMSICGTNIYRYSEENQQCLYSNYSLMWGWATWRRAWNKYNIELSGWKGIKKITLLNRYLNGNIKEIIYWYRILSQTQNNQINTWDYQWIYTCWSHNGLTVVPPQNLIKNIGFSADATHTNIPNPLLGDMSVYELKFPLQIPEIIAVNNSLDKFISSNWFGINWITCFKSILILIPGISYLLTRVRRFEK